MSDAIRSALDDAETAARKAVAALARVPAGEAELADLYAWGYTLTYLAEQTSAAAALLAKGTRDLAAAVPLRDDAGLRAARRVDQIVQQLSLVHQHSEDVRTAAGRYHSEVGHLGLDLRDDGTPE